MHTLTKLVALSMTLTMAGCLDGEDDALSSQELALEEAGSHDTLQPASPQASDAEALAASEGPVRPRGDDSAQVEQQGATPPITSLVGCTGYGCDNKDPGAMGCLADAQLLRTAWISYSASYLAKIEGWYSPACGAQWTRAVNWSSSPATLEASQMQGAVQFGMVWANNVPSGWTVTSKMFSAAYFMQACGEWGSGYTNCSTGY